MKFYKVALLIGGLAVASACNSKSPETTVDPSATQPDAEAPVVAPEAPPEPAEPEALPTLDEPHLDAFDLLANRPLAHRVEIGANGPLVLVDASSLDFVRYIHGNHPQEWALSVVLDEIPAAALKKKRKGSVWVPAQPGASQVHLKVYSPSDTNTLKLVVNDKPTDAQDLVKGWQVLSFESKDLGVENSIELDFSNMGRIAGNRSGGALSWLRVGTGDAKDDPTSVAKALPTAQGPLTLNADLGSFWNVWILENSKLDLELEVDETCGIDVEVLTEDGKGGIKSVLKADVRTLESKGRIQKTFVDLSGVPKGIARVDIRKGGECADVLVKRATLVVPGAVEVPEFDPPKYVVFWMVDTLRADHLPVHFETNVRAPNLKKLADEGASFKLAYVQGNESKTSHASLFTGMFPSKHRVLGRGHLKPDMNIMPEAMKAAKYQTGAYISNGYVSEPWGFVQGWDTYQNNLRSNFRIDAKSMAKNGIKWAAEHKEKPFFLYIGTVDPHVTYRRHDDLIGNYDTTPYSGKYGKACYGTDLGQIKGGKVKVSARDRERIQNLYKNEIEFNDIGFGELRAGLEEMGVWDQTMVIVTADHGDEFWEHDKVGHGHSVHQNQVHVPLIIYYPPAIKAGTVVEAGVDIADVYPTMVAMTGAKRTSELQGKSVLPLIHKVTGDYPEPAVATKYLIHYGMQMQQWKLYLRRGEYQLYDRENDHTEQTNVADAHPLASRWLLDSIGWFRAHRKAWNKDTWGAASNLSPEFIAKLKALE